MIIIYINAFLDLITTNLKVYRMSYLNWQILFLAGGGRLARVNATSVILSRDSVTITQIMIIQQIIIITTKLLKE